MRKDIEVVKWFEEDKKCFEASQNRKMESFNLLKARICEKRLIPRASSIEILRTQLILMNKKMILLQVLFFVILLLIYQKEAKILSDMDLYLLGAAAASVSSLFIVNSCMHEEKNNMAELTGTCYFNSRQLCVLRMLLYGGINLAVLSAIIVYTGKVTGSSLTRVGVYILAPYLFTGCLHFLVMLAGRGQSGIISTGLNAMVIVICCGGIMTFPEIYQKTAHGVWSIALVILGAVYITEIFSVLRQIDRGERLCMN